MATILVTGAAGFIGSHTSELLLEHNFQVLGVDDLSTGKLENIASFENDARWSFFQRDISQEGALDDLIVSFHPTAIIHLAALVSVQRSILDPDLNFRLNVWASHLIAELASRHGIPRIVFASSAAVYGNADSRPTSELAPLKPLSPYGAAKLSSERLLQDDADSYGFVVRHMRYFNVYGSRQDSSSPYSGVISRFIEGLKSGQGVDVYGSGEQTRDFISVEDVAMANLLAATGRDVVSGAANICTGRAVSLNDLLNIMDRIYPEGGGRRHKQAREGDVFHSCGDPFLAAKQLGFKAKTRIEDGIAALAAIPV